MYSLQYPGEKIDVNRVSRKDTLLCAKLRSLVLLARIMEICLFIAYVNVLKRKYQGIPPQKNGIFWWPGH